VKAYAKIIRWAGEATGTTKWLLVWSFDYKARTAWEKTYGGILADREPKQEIPVTIFFKMPLFGGVSV
jgi:hypothetical protein